MGKLLVLAVVAGCGPGLGGPSLSRRGDCGTPVDGVIALAWTIRAAAPSTQSCQGIDHLSVEIDGDLCGATIAPVPCTLDRWRYDNLPEGPVTATVTGVDVSGRSIVSGAVDVNLGRNAPTSPTPINLQ